MALPDDNQALTKAISGLFGIDEPSMLKILETYNSERLKAFREGASGIFSKDEHSFEKWDENHLTHLQNESLRFQTVVVQWTMHPWERDARLAYKVINQSSSSYGLLIELACTRSSEELFGVRKAYHSLYDQSIEEHIAYQFKSVQRKLLVALVSSYRYEGSRINDMAVKVEMEKLNHSIKNHGKKNPMEDEEIIRILTTRSKRHLKEVFKKYKEVYGRGIDEEPDIGQNLKETIQCLCTPPTYFSQVINAAFDVNADENVKEGLTRVIVTRSGVDLKDIAEEYNKDYGTPLIQKIEDVALGNYKDFLVAIMKRSA